MKFLAFTDLHEDKEVMNELVKRAAKDDIDFIIFETIKIGFL